MRKLTTKEFIDRATLLYNGLYTYNNSVYLGTFIKIEIYCTNCNKYFWQRPSDHLYGTGCPHCQKERANKIIKERASKLFLEKSLQIHKGLYDYSKVQYEQATSNVEIICTRCNKVFLQTPMSHLKGFGCRECNKPKLNTELFIIKAKEVHGDLYDYSKVVYTVAHNFVTIICNTCGKEFKQKAYSHLQGIGCSTHSTGYSRTQWVNFCNRKSSYDPKVYIINCFNSTESFIKIGITTGTVHNRFRRFKRQLPYSYKVLKEIKGSPDFVWDEEKRLHKLCKNFQYKPLIYFQGETECFTLNSLKLLPIY